MAIAFDATSQYEVGDSASLTISHTCTGTDRVLIVAVDNYNGGDTSVIPTVTYNGVSMTQVETVLYGSGTDQRITLFQLVAPATGANDIVVTASVSQSEMTLAAVSYTGVDQTTPLGTASTLSTTGVTSSSIDISSETDDFVIDSIAWFDQTITVGSGQTMRVENNNGAGNDSIAMSDEAGAATVTMSWSWAASENPGHIAVNMNAASTVQDITAGVLQQTVSAFNPTISPGVVSITPVLQQSLVVSYDLIVALVDVEMYPDLAQSLVSAYDPIISDITPDLVQQLIIAYDPTRVDAHPTGSFTFPPNWSNQHLPITLTGIATDDFGVISVKIRIYSRDKGVYWDGSAWATSTPVYLTCTLDNPSGTSTGWTYTFSPPDFDASNQAYWCPINVFDIYGNSTVSAASINFYALVDNVEPSLVQQLVSPIAPTLIQGGPVVNPGLKQQLVSAYSLTVFRAGDEPVVLGLLYMINATEPDTYVKGLASETFVEKANLDTTVRSY